MRQMGEHALLGGLTSVICSRAFLRSLDNSARSDPDDLARFGQKLALAVVFSFGRST